MSLAIKRLENWKYILLLLAHKVLEDFPDGWVFFLLNFECKSYFNHGENSLEAAHDMKFLPFYIQLGQSVASTQKL